MRYCHIPSKCFEIQCAVAAGNRRKSLFTIQRLKAIHRRGAETLTKRNSQKLRDHGLRDQFLNSSIPQSVTTSVNPEPLAKLDKTVTPVISGVWKTLKNLDSGPRTRHFRGRLRRNDVEGLLQEAL
jgi:hypothetical protein